MYFNHDFQRHKRQTEENNLNEDSIRIQSGSYDGDDTQGDTEGMRIYDAWFQHRNSENIPKSRMAVPQSSDDEAIRPHHRISASWVERKRKSSHDLNAHFDDKVFRDSYPSRSSGSGSSSNRRRTNSGQAIDLPQTNFYKITPTQQVCLNLVNTNHG